MFRPLCAGALAAAVALPLADAAAHAIAGARIFPVTLTIDDPGVADEASLPTITYQRSGADGGPGPLQSIDLGAEYDKRVTDNFAVGINDDYRIQDTEHDKIRTGVNDIVVTGKYQIYVNAPRELTVSAGIAREFARTGSAHVGADQYGFTQANLYGGKGLGDLPIAALRPFAITGEISYVLADKELKVLQAPSQPGGLQTSPMVAGLNFNNGFANSTSGGLSLQYSIPYLTSQVRDIPVAAFFKHLVPLVELAWSAPASSPGNSATRIVVAPGVIWIGSKYQVGIEALIPANRSSGTNVGFITQFHLFLDDLLPRSLGRPIFQ